MRRMKKAEVSCMYLTSTWLFFFNDTATTEIYTLSLHDALPIYGQGQRQPRRHGCDLRCGARHGEFTSDGDGRDRKSTRLNSSHANISYAVFCLKKHPPGSCRGGRPSRGRSRHRCISSTWHRGEV